MKDAGLLIWSTVAVTIGVASALTVWVVGSALWRVWERLRQLDRRASMARHPAGRAR